MEQTVTLAAIVALLALVVLVALDLFGDGVREWFAKRAVLSGVVSGGLLLAPLLLFVERRLESAQRKRDQQLASAQRKREELQQRALRELEEERKRALQAVEEERKRALQAVEEERAQRELERWKQPAEEAVKTYLDVARGLTGELSELLEGEDSDFNMATATEADYAELYTQLAERIHPPPPRHFFSRLYAVAREGAARSGAVAIGATTAIALYPPRTDYSERISEVQRLTREFADCCLAINLGRRSQLDRRKMPPSRPTSNPRFGGSRYLAPVGGR